MALLLRLEIGRVKCGISHKAGQNVARSMGKCWRISVASMSPLHKGLDSWQVARRSDTAKAAGLRMRLGGRHGCLIFFGLAVGTMSRLRGQGLSKFCVGSSKPSHLGGSESLAQAT